MLLLYGTPAAAQQQVNPMTDVLPLLLAFGTWARHVLNR
jgi:hypothetical protein